MSERHLVSQGDVQYSLPLSSFSCNSAPLFLFITVVMNRNRGILGSVSKLHNIQLTASY